MVERSVIPMSDFQTAAAAEAAITWPTRPRDLAAWLGQKAANRLRRLRGVRNPSLVAALADSAVELSVVAAHFARQIERVH